MSEAEVVKGGDPVFESSGNVLVLINAAALLWVCLVLRFMGG